MRRKRHLRKSPQARAASHLKKLGFVDQGDYTRWCACNGFAPSLNKSPEDRQSELLHALIAGPGWRGIQSSYDKLKIRVRGDSRDVEDKIFSGQLTSRHLVEKQYQPLVRAVERLAGPDFEQNQLRLRRLFNVCRQHNLGLFSYGGRPYPGCQDTTLAEALALVAIDGDHWIREPEDWPAPTGSHFDCFRDLVSFLYANHPMPELLFRIWFERDVREFNFSLYVMRHVAAGHSVRTLPIGIQYSKRMSHFFLRGPIRFTVRQALRWGQVRGMGGCERLAVAVALSLLAKDFSNGPFWTSVIEWLIKNPIEEHLVRHVIRYLNNQKFGVGNVSYCTRDHRGRIRREQMPIAQPGLTMKGRTARALVRDVQRFRELEQAHGHMSEYAWAESGIRSFLHQDAWGDVWTIDELLGNGALFQEGRRMNHCVGGYTEDCLEGSSTIWSMCRLNENGRLQHLTVEVDPKAYEIVQARGHANRLPSDDEMTVLKAWARAAHLDWRPIETQEQY